MVSSGVAVFQPLSSLYSVGGFCGKAGGVYAGLREKQPPPDRAKRQRTKSKCLRFMAVASMQRVEGPALKIIREPGKKKVSGSDLQENPLEWSHLCSFAAALLFLDMGIFFGRSYSLTAHGLLPDLFIKISLWTEPFPGMKI
jgi:hypothetical protein